MKWNDKNKIANRIGAAVLSVVMVLSLIPVYSLPVSAETQEHSDAVSITSVTSVETDGFSAILYTGTGGENPVYDGNEHAIVTDIKRKGESIIGDDNYKIEYNLNHAEDWTTEVPYIKNAGTYNIQICVSIESSDDTSPAIVELDPSTVIIEKADQEIAFHHYDTETTFSFDAEDSSKNVYDFSAAGGALAFPDITYSVENDSESDVTDIAEIAEIDADGKLTVKAAGFNIKVIAAAAGDSNYSDASVECHVTIPDHADDLITFANRTESYVVGTNTVISNQAAIKAHSDDNGTVTYSAKVNNVDISSQDLGISMNANTGELTANYEKLSDALVNNGNSLTIVVTADKTAGTKKQIDGISGWTGKTVEVYAACEAAYNVKVSFETMPADTYQLKDPNENVLTGPNGTNGWFNTPVTVVPAADGYTIAKDSAADFSSSVEFHNQGTSVRKIYLKNTSTGGITAPVTIDVEKIDSEKPDSGRIDIEYLEQPAIISELLWFYDAPVRIKFTAYDETSGVDSFTWKYTRSSDASISNLESDGGTAAAVQDTIDPTKFTGEITLPQSEVWQMKGNLTVNATDKAGLTDEDKKDDGRIIVIDTVSPTETVSYQLETAGGTTQTVKDKHYFSDNVEFTFDVTEANFFEADVIVKVSKNGGTAQEVNVTWNTTANQDEHEARYVLSGDGEYVVTMEYKNRMAHRNGKYVTGAVTVYTSEMVIIDTDKPVIEFSYSNGNQTSASPDDAQTATISITEHNFRASDLIVDVDAKDILGSDVAAEDLQTILQNADWSKKGDVYTATLSDEFVDAIYNLTFNYKDLALNSAETVKTGKFIVDHTAPAADSMKVTYTTPITKSILEKLTFGYYNPDVTVKFEAVDMTSGVDYFTWSYTKESGASEINVESYVDTAVAAVQDTTDKSKFAASITLPKKAAEQLRGNIAFTATDKYGNTSEKITDGNNIIVVDTVTPVMTVEYSEPAGTAGGKMYYNKNMTAAFTVKEANFYAEDVVVEISKNGGAFVPVSLAWKESSADVHVGTYTIAAPGNHSGDADYVFRVTYTDRSNNQMSTYTSDTITIDTMKPEIDVVYSNNNAINTLNDPENHKRQYFDAAQTATVTITEHNFEASEVDFTILAKDIAGKELDINSLNSKTSWSTSGDKHVITITYPGDANYTFDVAYTDLAANDADDYAPDYFTVDKTAPENLTVSCSNSVLDTVLQAITFGFYNAQMTVTITAEDSTASVHGFKYNYTLASGVSAVNAELINQAIDEAGITYSNGHRTAAVQFKIPKSALGNSNQFNGNVSFTAADRSGNESSQFNDTKRIVVDNIAPTAAVTYNAPVRVSGGVSYYDGAVTATVTMKEANFYAEDVQVSVTRNGAAYSVTPDWSSNSADVHVGTFNLSDDGDYFVTINYADKSGNRMVSYTSEQMTVDTEIIEPVITVNGEEANGKAFKDDVIPAVSFEDINFESYEIKLSRTRCDDIDADVTETFIGNSISINDQGGTGSFDTFVKEQDADGIYTMTVSMTDKAGHSAETSATFTVNRFGSVYKYGDYLISLIKDGGAYVQDVEDDLVITEYNADRLLSGSLDIQISRDGKPISDVDYELTPQMNDQVSVGSSGWYQYEYIISKDNFDTDGVYKISVSSKDATGNSPETTNYEDKNIVFRVDSTAPEINSITGFEDSIINAQNVNAEYTVYDTIGLASVKVYVDGEEVDTITDFAEDLNNYTGSFTVSEKNSVQSIRLVVEDLAGNVTDTDSDEFQSAFAFHKLVTVSTNFFVRFFANTTLFWGSVIGVIAVAAVIILLLAKKRKKEI